MLRRGASRCGNRGERGKEIRSVLCRLKRQRSSLHELVHFSLLLLHVAVELMQLLFSNGRAMGCLKHRGRLWRNVGHRVGNGGDIGVVV